MNRKLTDEEAKKVEADLEAELGHPVTAADAQTLTDRLNTASKMED